MSKAVAGLPPCSTRSRTSARMLEPNGECCKKQARERAARRSAYGPP
jgi:hypothetical protein